MSFAYDSKGSNTLTGNARSAAGIFTNDSLSMQGITWQSDFNTWAMELRTWAQAASQLILDIKNS